MKNLLIVIGLFLTIQSQAQINSVGKSEAMVWWDILGRNNTPNGMNSNYWKTGDTTVMSITRVEIPIPYHPIYYFVKGICVKQRIICLRSENGCSHVDKIYDYTAPEDIANNVVVYTYDKKR